MKLKIEIKAETGIYENENIVEIDINNGNWKYWDTYCETEEKQTLTMNNFYNATYLNQPVKDAIAHYDQEKLESEEMEIVQDDAYVRTYKTLMVYLNCIIGNIKDSYKKYGKTKLTTHIVLFKQVWVKHSEEDIVVNIEYEKDKLLEVKIVVVE